MCSDVLCSHRTTRIRDLEELESNSYKIELGHMFSVWREGVFMLCLLLPYSPGGQHDVHIE